MIAIVGGKGGCGKTTTTLATTRALVSIGVDARAVDLDVGMPNLHRMADVEREPSLTALIDENDRSEATTIQRDARGAEIVPAPRPLEAFDRQALLDVVRLDRGVTLLDCPAGAGPAATAPLREADAAIVVTTDRSESVEDATKTVRMARNLDIPILGAVVTRTERASHDVEAALGIDRVFPIPECGDPLTGERARDGYLQIANRIRSWLENARGSSLRTAECPNCDGIQAPRPRDRPSDDRRLTRPPGRRSPRSRVRGDARSSSRDGGAPSDPK